MRAPRGSRGGRVARSSAAYAPVQGGKSVPEVYYCVGRWGRFDVVDSEVFVV